MTFFSFKDKFVSEDEVEELVIPEKLAQDAEFEESKHPRADNGQFGEGGGGASNSSESEKKTEVNEAGEAELTKENTAPKKGREYTFSDKEITDMGDDVDKVSPAYKEQVKDKETGKSKYVPNPFASNRPNLPPEVEVFVKKAIRDDNWGSIDKSFIRKEKINPRNVDIVSYQEAVTKSQVDKYVNDPKMKPDKGKGFSNATPHLVKILGRYYSRDGNHRLTAALMLDRDIDVKVIDMDAALKATQDFHRENPDKKSKYGIFNDLEKGAAHHKSKPQGQDSFAMDRATVRRIDDDGHLFVEQTPISKANVCPYYGKEIPDFHALGLDPEKTYKLYRDPEELKKAAATFAGKPLLLVHTAISSDEHPREVVVGSIGDNVEFKAPYLMAPLSIWDGEAIGLVQSGKQKELSSAYRYRADMTPGKADGESYDGVMRDIGGNHVALVKEGRAGPDVVVGDSKQEIPMKKTTLLSRKAVLAQGALMAYFSPKLAQDAKLAIAPMLVGVNAQNYSAKIPGLVKSLTAASKGKLAQDADITDLVELLDGLKDGDMPVEDAMEPNDGTVENKAMKARGYDAVKEILKDKLSAEDMKACDDAMEDDGDGQEAMDEDQDDEDDDKKDKKDKKDNTAEDEEVKEEKVTKKAMDAAIAKSVRVAQDEMRKSQREIREAEEVVLPYVGKLAMAHDSAADVYRTALTALNVNVDDVHPSAFKAIIVNLPKPGSQPTVPASRVAMDEKSVSSFTEMYPTAGAVKHL